MANAYIYSIKLHHSSGTGGIGAGGSLGVVVGGLLLRYELPAVSLNAYSYTGTPERLAILRIDNLRTIGSIGGQLETVQIDLDFDVINDGPTEIVAHLITIGLISNVRKWFGPLTRRTAYRKSFAHYDDTGTIHSMMALDGPEPFTVTLGLEPGISVTEVEGIALWPSELRVGPDVEKIQDLMRTHMVSTSAPTRLVKKT
jgi:hypothetical protein